MESKLIEVVKKATNETEKFLNFEGYKINKHLKFNLFAFNYMISLIQLRHFETMIPDFKFDLISFRNEFSKEMVKELKSIKPDEADLKKLTSFTDDSKHIGTWPSSYESNLKLFLEHKGVMISEFMDYVSEMQNELKNVMEAFKNANEGRGKYKVPSKTYISFFKFPLVFLSPDDRTIPNLMEDFFLETMDFLETYIKLSSSMQKFMMPENLEILQINGIKIK